MINTAGIEKVLGYKSNTIWHKRSRVNEHNIYPSIKMMEKQLVKAGWIIMQQTLWAKK